MTGVLAQPPRNIWIIGQLNNLVERDLEDVLWYVSVLPNLPTQVVLTHYCVRTISWLMFVQLKMSWMHLSVWGILAGVGIHF